MAFSHPQRRTNTAVVFVATLLAYSALGCAGNPPPAPTLPTVNLDAVRKIECGGQLVQSLLSVSPETAASIERGVIDARPMTADEAAIIREVINGWRYARQCLGIV